MENMENMDSYNNNIIPNQEFNRVKKFIRNFERPKPPSFPSHSLVEYNEDENRIRNRYNFTDNYPDN